MKALKVAYAQIHGEWIDGEFRYVALSPTEPQRSFNRRWKALAWLHGWRPPKRNRRAGGE